jgi:hypothetical protein
MRRVAHIYIDVNFNVEIRKKMILKVRLMYKTVKLGSYHTKKLTYWVGSTVSEVGFIQQDFLYFERFKGNDGLDHTLKLSSVSERQL